MTKKICELNGRYDKLVVKFSSGVEVLIRKFYIVNPTQQTYLIYTDATGIRQSLGGGTMVKKVTNSCSVNPFCSR